LETAQAYVKVCQALGSFNRFTYFEKTQLSSDQTRGEEELIQLKQKVDKLKTRSIAALEDAVKVLETVAPEWMSD
jgi:uncharacterized sporulation protein YeaH/YhbH (DUF444 family)